MVTSTSTASSFDSSRVHSLTRPNIVSVGTIVWLSSELMFFAGLFAMYFSIRSVHANDWPMTLPDGKDIKLSVAYALAVHDHPGRLECHLPVRASSRPRRATSSSCVAGSPSASCIGLIFVLGQANEYRIQVHDGNTISATGYGSVFFLTTGFHGLHVIGGLLAFIYFLIRTTLSKFTPAQATAAIVVSYYWHFVDVVWIGLFATIYLIR